MENQNYGESQTPPDYRNTYANTNPPAMPPVNEIPPMKPTTWLWQAIAITFCCSPIFGIIGIIFAAKVNSLYYNGEYDESLVASKRARMWVLIGLIVGIVGTIVSMIVMFTGGFAESLNQALENNASDYNF